MALKENRGRDVRNNDRVPVSVVILTFNEEKNIEDCLKSISGWAEEIFIVDSHSNDKTLEIAKGYTDKIYQNKFVSYSHQRNWALDNIPFSNEWVFFLDADERPSDELKCEISSVLTESIPDVYGYFIKRRFIFMGTWIKHGGYYPVWLMRLFRHKYTRCHEREVDEYFIVNGNTSKLKYDIIHNDNRGIAFWIDRHNKYATLEVREYFKLKGQKRKLSNFSTNSLFEKKGLIKRQIWKYFPSFFSPFIGFFYSYILRGGFLDGKAGLIYNFLLRFWYLLLIDIKIKEIRKERKTQ